MRTCKGEQRHEETETAYVRPAVLLGTALPVWAEDAAAGTPAPDSAGQAEEVAPAAEAQQGRPNEAAPAEAGGVQAPAQPQAAAVPRPSGVQITRRQRNLPFPQRPSCAPLPPW